MMNKSTKNTLDKNRKALAKKKSAKAKSDRPKTTLQPESYIYKNGVPRLRMPRKDWTKKNTPRYRPGCYYWVRAIGDYKPAEGKYKGRGWWLVDGNRVRVEWVGEKIPSKDEMTTGQIGRGVGVPPIKSRAQKAIDGLKEMSKNTPFPNGIPSEGRADSNVDQEAIETKDDAVIAQLKLKNKLITEMQIRKDCLDQDAGGVWKAIALGIDWCIEVVKDEME